MESQQRGKFRLRKFSGSANDGAGLAQRPARLAQPVHLPGCPKELFTVDDVYNDLRMHCGGRRSQDSVAANVRQGSFQSLVLSRPVCVIPLCRQSVKDDQEELEKRKGIGTGWERCTKERTEGSDDVKSK